MAYIGPSFIRATKNDTVTVKFTMTVADVPTDLTTPTLKGYEEGNVTEFTGGITLTAPYDGKAGLNELVIDTSNAAYNAGKNYAFVFTAGTIGAVTVVGTAILQLALIPDPANVTLWNSLATVALPLTPTTAGRTLDVSATGEAGVDWANVGSPTTTLNLSGTTVKAVTDRVMANTDQIEGVDATDTLNDIEDNPGTGGIHQIHP